MNRGLDRRVACGRGLARAVRPGAILAAAAGAARRVRPSCRVAAARFWQVRVWGSAVSISRSPFSAVPGAAPTVPVGVTRFPWRPIP